MATKKESRATFIIIIIIICIPFLSGIAYKYRDELKLKKRAVQVKERLFYSGNKTVRINLTAGVNDKDMRIVFSISCKDMKTKQKILDNMSIIKHEMLMSMDNSQNIKSVEKRNFKRLKLNCLKILKKYAPVDVSKVYVEFFAHN